MIHIVWKSFNISCSHCLNHLNYDSPCKNTHGHNYEIQIGMCGTELNENGMVIDFSKIKKVFKEKVHDCYDHKHLNDVYPFSNPRMPPTAENMARMIYDIFAAHFGKEKMFGVRVYETPTSYAEYVNI